MTVWIFILLLSVPTFGGEVRVTSEHQTLEGCIAFRKVVAKELRDLSVRHTLSECESR